MNARKCPLFILTLAALLALAGAQILLPDRKTSDMENRTLATAPKLSVESVLSGRFMSSCEGYIADQMPLRDTFISAYAIYEAAQQKQMRNGVLIGERGFMFETGKSISEKLIQENTEAFAEIAKAAGIDAYICAAPLSSSVYREYAPQNYNLPDGSALEAAASADGITTIPLLGSLIAAKDSQPLYYMTDHHWTAKGAEAAYRQICAKLGIEPKSGGEVKEQKDFRGSYFARSPSPLQTLDTLTYYSPEGVELEIENSVKDGLADAETLAGRDKYSALLYGNHAMIKLTSKVDSGVLFVIKDSYANALLPYLSQNFGTIYAIDPRYYTGDILADIHDTNAETLLCIYGINTLGESRDPITLAADAMEDE